MSINYADRAEEYYKLIGAKKVEEIQNYLDPDVVFISPLATLKGREAVVEATTNFMQALTALTIRGKFCAANQAMIVYNVDIPGVSNNFPGASLLTFRNNMIVDIELFHDTSRFVQEF